MREEVMEMKTELEELKEQSLAKMILEDYKKTNVRMFFIIIALLIAWFITIFLFVNHINTTGYEMIETNTKTQEISDIETIENSNIINGDMYGENKAN